MKINMIGIERIYSVMYRNNEQYVVYYRKLLGKDRSVTGREWRVLTVNGKRVSKMVEDAVVRKMGPILRVE